MTGLAIATDLGMLAHVAGPMHPERPARLEAVLAGLDRAGLLARAAQLPVRPATEEDLRLCHTDAYIAHVRESCRLTRPLTPDTGVGPASFAAAMLAAGAGLAAGDAISDGAAWRAFCAVRPPGHHAETAKGGGFCLFNNVAIAARHLLHRRGMKRVAIVDLDVHHGNGTQEIFWRDGAVLFCSVHQHGPNPLNPAVPFYPGTGAESETGEGAGAGLILNVAVPPHARGDVYARAFRDRIVPAIERFRPETLLVSAGFDAHRDDPLALVELDAEDFAELTRQLVAAAERVCGGKVLSLLEGGYHLDALSACAAAHVGALAA